MVKIIHTFNFWKYFEKFPLAETCLNSMSLNSPNAKVIVWTESDEIIKNEMANSPFIKYIWSHSQYDDYARRLGTIDYLKMFILYKFGGGFIDADIEIKTPISFSQSFTMNYALNVAPCSPIYFSEPNNPVLKEVLDRFNDTEHLTSDIFDWTMCNVETLSESAKEFTSKMTSAGISENVQYNHWISLFYDENEKCPKFWLTRKIDELKYFETQKDFDEYLKVNLFPDIHKKFENFKFIFIAEDIITPFLFTTSQNIKILKASKETCVKYLSYYLGKNVIFGENNELQLQ